jgi:hypothetical protein
MFPRTILKIMCNINKRLHSNTEFIQTTSKSQECPSFLKIWEKFYSSLRPKVAFPTNDRFNRFRHLRDRFLPSISSPNVGKHRRVVLVEEQPVRGFIMLIYGLDVHNDVKH